MIGARATYSAIGLDIVPDRIKLLQLKWQKGTLSIQEAAQAEVAPPAEKIGGQDGAGLSSALRKLLAKGKFKGKQTIAALPNHMVTTIPIRFSLKEGEDMDQAILREANNYLSFPLEKGVIDYLNLPLSEQRSAKAALLIASRREDIISCLDLLREVGLDPSVIEPRYCALFRAVKWARQGERLPDQFILSVEENCTMFLTVVDEQILVVREIAWGTGAIRARMGKILGLTGEKVDRILHTIGVDPGKSTRLDRGRATGSFLDEGELGQVIYEVLSPILEELCQEIQKVLSYCVSLIQQRVIDRAILLGEGAKIRFLDRFIHQRTGIQVMALPSIAPIGESTYSNTFFDVALGLALRGIREGVPSQPLILHEDLLTHARLS
ncbi:MAG: pilus assembly protein PilM [bacterium]|nr:pilus assembly protein PilM [bacterium]